MASAAEVDGAIIILASGQSVVVRAVVLYPESIVAEIAALRAQAMKQLGGVSTGIGFIGSPEWAIGGAVAIGLVEGLLSASAKKDGLEKIQLAQQKSMQLRDAAIEFPLSAVCNVDIPHPHAWSAVRREEYQRPSVSDAEERQRLKNLARLKGMRLPADFLPPPGEIRMETHVVETRYVHSGDEFVSVKTDIGKIDIRWSYVVGYYRNGSQIQQD